MFLLNFAYPRAKVRARLSKPLERGKGKSQSGGDIRVDRPPAGRRPRAPWNRPLPPCPLPARVRGLVSRGPVATTYRGLKRLVGVSDRHPLPPLPGRASPLPPPPKSYDRRAPAPASFSSSLKRAKLRREELPPRSRAVVDYASRLPLEIRPSYRDEYTAHSPVYSNVHKSSAPRSSGISRRPYSDDSYVQHYERPPSSYREGRLRDYDSVSGSKRPHSAVDDAPARYTDLGRGVRHSTARLDYDIPGSASQYEDTLSDSTSRSYRIQ